MKLKFFVIIFVIFVIISLLSQFESENALSLSPSFSRQIATDFKKSLIQETPLDIKSVVYNSDGRTLNATAWLSSNQNNILNRLRYGMQIYVTNYTFPAYDAYIQQDNRTWTKKIIEYEPNQQNSNISLGIVKNYDPFYKNRGYYIHLSLNLDIIGSPQAYKVVFYTALKDGAHIGQTGRYLFPPLNPINSTWPQPSVLPSLKLNPGSIYRTH